MFILILILAACNSPELSLTEIQNVPNKIQEAINSDDPLQLIYEGENNVYLVFQSKDTVVADFEMEDHILTIELDEENQDNNELKQYVYKFSRDETQYDTIYVLVNGESTPLADTVLKEGK